MLALVNNVPREMFIRDRPLVSCCPRSFNAYLKLPGTGTVLVFIPASVAY